MRYWLLILTSTFFMTKCWAASLGVSFSQAKITRDPDHLKGYQVGLIYQPDKWVWPRNRLYLNIGWGHWWLTQAKTNNNLNIYSISPMFRHYFNSKKWIFPFIQFGIGLSWLTRTRLDQHNLGMHFAFQDQIGIGASFGLKKHFSFIASIFHYSNASLSANNGGITAPLVLTAEYQFD